jgi:hypothetical protein
MSVSPTELKPEPGAIHECPYCHTRVIVRADLSCPACQMDMRGVADDGRRRLKVGEGSILPHVCAHCGEPADGARRIDVSRAVDDGGANGFQRIVVKVASALLLDRLLHVNAQRRIQLDIDVPVCAGCWERSSLVPQHVNFADRTVTLLVHRRLSEAVAQLLAE